MQRPYKICWCLVWDIWMRAPFTKFPHSFGSTNSGGFETHVFESGLNLIIHFTS